ncbi:MAG: hypothetical protein H6732_16750 [Alphaproteobacteria bacterium]|nr:hypothetical protein [Alphaproteobacteria bacterium]
MRTARAGLLLCLAALAGGCTYAVRLVSDPPGATLTLPDGTTAVTPHLARFRRGPSQLVHVQAPGYRPVDIDLQRTEGRLLRYIGGAVFQRGGREVTILMVREHGPIGTATDAE